MGHTHNIIKLKQGLAADINSDATKTKATLGEPHYATDTKQLYIFDGTDNVVVGGAGDFIVATDLTVTNDFTNANTLIKDMGAFQFQDLRGYNNDWMIDKNLYNITIKTNSNTFDGGLRTIYNDDTGICNLQLYTDGKWNTLLAGVEITLDNDEADIEFTGYTKNISLIDGDSDIKGINGLPIIQDFKQSMGAYPQQLVISGGDF